MENNNKAIGIFDSGVGGLSAVQAIRQRLPNENLVYYADVEYSPYGEKSADVIEARCQYISQRLVEQGCKAIVVACNTATVNTIKHLRDEFAIPFIGIEPGVKPATEQTQSGHVGVLATEQTLKSESYQRLIDKYGQRTHIHSVACPQFVTLVEQLMHSSQEAERAAQEYIAPLLSAGCDQIVLGCTHFSFLHSTISKVVGSQANIIDTPITVAEELHRRLTSASLLTSEPTSGKLDILTSGNPVDVKASIAKLIAS